LPLPQQREPKSGEQLRVRTRKFERRL
jgi:hypothetical protein